MSLLFVGPRGSFELRWDAYAILRDNVLHHLEEGHRSGAFRALHDIAAALGGGTVRVSASALRADVARAQASLGDLPRERFAVSDLTLAALAPGRGTSREHATRLGGGLFLEPSVRTLSDVCGPLWTSIIRITEACTLADTVEVHDL